MPKGNSFKEDPGVRRMSSKSNHGIVMLSGGGGGTTSNGGAGGDGKINIAYGRDSSYLNGTAAQEQGQAGFKGGDRDASSSVTGATVADGGK